MQLKSISIFIKVSYTTIRTQNDTKYGVSELVCYRTPQINRFEYVSLHKGQNFIEEIRILPHFRLSNLVLLDLSMNLI